MLFPPPRGESLKQHIKRLPVYLQCKGRTRGEAAACSGGRERDAGSRVKRGRRKRTRKGRQGRDNHVSRRGGEREGKPATIWRKKLGRGLRYSGCHMFGVYVLDVMERKCLSLKGGNISEHTLLKLSSAMPVHSLTTSSCRHFPLSSYKPS